MHLAVDFGTCFTSTAVLLENNQFSHVRDIGGGNYFASAACVDDAGELLFGALAKNTARRNPARFRQEFKRDLGSNVPYRLGDLSFLPENLIAHLLARLKAEAEKKLGRLLPALVLTVPASYDEHRRGLMTSAAVAAGFREDGVVLLDEPEAAVIYYDWHLRQRQKTLPDGAVVLIYDLGGGTFNAALMRKDNSRFRGMTPAVGDPHCGGIDFDQAIYKEVLKAAEQETQDLLEVGDESLSSLRMKLQMADFCRDVKHQLSHLPRYADVLPGLAAEDFTLEQSVFEKAIKPDIDKTIAICDDLVRSAGIDCADVDGILLTGGSSQIPLVTRTLTEWFDRPIWEVDDPKLAVCMGGAVRPGYRRTLTSTSVYRVAQNNPLLVTVGDGDDQSIKLWNGMTGEMIRSSVSGGNSCVAISPDGQTIARGTHQLLTLHGVESGEELQRLTGHSTTVLAAAFNPDGKILASTSNDVRLWNTSTGELIHAMSPQHYIRGVAFSPDGLRLATCGDDRKVSLWNVEMGSLLRTTSAHGDYLIAVAFSPDGSIVASGGNDKIVKLWNAETGALIHELVGHESRIQTVKFSRDGKQLTTGSSDGDIALWDTETGDIIRDIVQDESVIIGFDYSPDGRVIAAACGDNLTRLWNVETGELIRTLPGHGTTVEGLAFTRRPVDRLASSNGHYDSVYALAVRSKSRTLVSGGADQTVKFWNIDTGDVDRSDEALNGPINSLICTGPEFAAADNSLWFFDKPSKSNKSLERVEPEFGPRSGINWIAASADGRSVATAHNDALLCIWDVERRELAHVLYGHRGSVYSTAFSPDGAQLFSGSEDGTVGIWNVKTRELLATLEGHEGPVQSVALSPDGKTLASSGDDGNVRVWDVATRRVVHVLSGHAESVWCVAFSHDGSTIASAGADKRVRLWNVATGDLLQTLDGHEDKVNVVIFAGDDNHLVSAGDDRSVRFWKLDWA